MHRYHMYFRNMGTRQLKISIGIIFLKFSLFIEQIYAIMITNKEAYMLCQSLSTVQFISVLSRTMLHID